MEDRLESEVRIEAPSQCENEGSTAQAPGEPGDDFADAIKDISPETKMLISRCIEGTEPLDRPLKIGEPQKLSPKAVQAVLLRAAGFKGGEVAKLVDLDQQRVSVLCNHPYGKKIISALLQDQGGRVLDIRSKMEDYATLMLDHTINIALKEVDLNAIQKVTFALLDRTGHGPTQKIEVDSKPSKTLNEDVYTLRRLTAALEESQSIGRITQHYRQVPPPLDAPVTGAASREDPFSEERAPRSSGPPADLQLPRTGT